MNASTDAGASPLRLFIPITKIDVEKRTVYGQATAEHPDRSGEICDYASTKPYYEKWSGEIAKNTGGKSVGNLRAMHQKIAAGKLTSINFDDDNKQVLIAAKVVDDGEWEKCLEGVYTGFSQGGRYVDRWPDPVTKLTRYTADPTEISLVDLPCLPTATFSVVKASGVEETKAFKSTVTEPTVKEVMDYAYGLAKSAGAENPSDAQINEARRALLNAALAKADAGAGLAKAGPTDDEVEQRAREIAISDGATEISDAHRAKAREQLKQGEPTPIQDIDSDAVRELEVPRGDPSNGATAMTAEDGVTLKAAEPDKDEPVQVWKIGAETFPTKREALKAAKDRRVAKALAEVTAPVESVLGELNRTLGIEKKDYSDAERKKMIESGEAMPGDPPRYPIKTKADVENAVKDWNRTGQAADVKAHILARAKALGCTDCVPDDWTKKASEPDDLTKENSAPSHADRMAQHTAMTMFHAAQDGLGHMAAAAAHAAAYSAHSAAAPDAEEKTKTAFQASRDCMGSACKDAGIAGLLKTAGAAHLVKDAVPPTDKAAVHAAMANFHAKMGAEPGPMQDMHRQAAAAHAMAHVAQAMSAPDADAKSDEAFKCTMKCMGPEKALQASALFGGAMGKADHAKAIGGLREARGSIFARLGKGLPTVARLAELIEDLQWVLKAVWMEAKQENDNSPLPMKLKADVASLCDTLNAMVAEETKELIAGQNVDDLYTAADAMADQGVMASARIASLVKFMRDDPALAKAGEALAGAGDINASIAVLTAAVEGRRELAKAGRRNSAADMARIQKVHDLATDLGADCMHAAGKAVHVSGGEAMEKLDALTAENANLKATLADYGTQLTHVLGEVKKLKASPAPARAALFAVSKDGEVARAAGSREGPTEEEFAKAWALMTPDQRALYEIKKSHANPVRHIEA